MVGVVWSAVDGGMAEIWKGKGRGWLGCKVEGGYEGLGAVKKEDSSSFWMKTGREFSGYGKNGQELM